jgi:hypothetical protein
MSELKLPSFSPVTSFEVVILIFVVVGIVAFALGRRHRKTAMEETRKVWRKENKRKSAKWED